MSGYQTELAKFESTLQGPRSRVLEHPLYARLQNLGDLREFMQCHIFAVWDFMSLLKTLQRHLTCTTVPWVPSRDASAARFINEIVVAEESDEISPGVYKSHFELYLEAMRQMRADTSAIESFLGRVELGMAPSESFNALDLPHSVPQFVRVTLGFCKLGPHQVAAAFLFGREDIIPQMFERLLRQMNLYDAPDFALLRLYLQRHIELDEGAHAPLARKMLASLCGDSAQKWREAEQTALAAIEARAALWDGVAERFENRDGLLLTADAL
jgi:hypothetical protein